MNDDLVTWLRAQLDAIEGVARTGVGAHDWRLRDFARLILRDVEAKRRIVAEYDAALANLKRHPDDLPGKGWLLATVRVVKLLALPYSDRPGYRDEWRSEPSAVRPFTEE